MKNSAENWNKSATEPIRVLHIVSGMDAGGLETLIMNLYRNIDRSRIQFDYLCFRNQHEFYDEEFQALGGHKYVILSKPAKNFSERVQSHIAYNRQYYRLLKENKYTAVHIHFGIPDSFRWIRIAHKAGVRNVILHVHRAQAIRKEPVFFRLRNQLAFHMADQSLACSRLAADYFFGKRLGAKTMILKNGISVEEYAFSNESRELVRNELKISENDFVLGHVGGLKYPKNQAFLIELLAKIKEQIPKAKLLLVGDGPDYEHLTELADALHLRNQVVFTGSRGDVANILCAMDVFLFPSIHEGLGIAPIEAQASGLPVIVSDTVPREINCTGEVRFLPLNNPGEWEQVIAKVYLEHNRRCSKMELIEKEGYSSSNMADQMLKVYKFQTRIKRGAI